jgi:hypothetical protein
MSSKENVATILDEERRSIPPRRLPPIPEDKLHRVSIFFFKNLNKIKNSFREIHIQYDKKVK